MSFEDDMCKECKECIKNIACFDIRYGDREDTCKDFEPLAFIKNETKRSSKKGGKGSMTENDYIAEYIKDKYSSLLGVDYAMWKFARQLGNVAHDILKTFKQIPSEDLSKAIAEMENSEE